MISFRHILCPIDFSDTSARVLTYTAIATWYEAQLTVLHVATTFNELSSPYRSATRPIRGLGDDIITALGPFH